MLNFSGPHGAGKSTVASLLAKDHGFVYFEVDSLMMFSSPFVDPNLDEPSLQSLKQKPLKVVVLIFDNSKYFRWMVLRWKIHTLIISILYKFFFDNTNREYQKMPIQL